MGLYGLRRGDYRFGVGRTTLPIIPVLESKAREGVIHAVTFHDKNTEKTVHISLDGWSHRFFKAHDTFSFPIRGDAVMDEQGLFVTIENKSSNAILNSQIYFAGRFFVFGDIAPGKKQVKRIWRSLIENTARFRIEAAGSVAEGIVPEPSTSLVENMQRGLMERVLLSIHSRYHTEQDALCLFGWIAASRIPIHPLSPNIRGEGAALFEWETRVGPNRLPKRTG